VQTFVVNNNLAWLYVPQERQISLFDARTFFSSALARAFFEGVFELKKQFQVALDHGQSNSSQVTLILTPKEEDPHIQSLRLSIDLQSYRILSAETRDALGNTNRVVVQNQREKPALDPKFFELEVPPATTVIDREGRELSPAEVQQLRQNLK
jgi:outer membrane lipoprotein carrier protein